MKPGESHHLYRSFRVNTTGFNQTNCTANGYTLDLAGKKERYVGNNQPCTHEEFKWFFEGGNAPDKYGVQEAEKGRNPNNVICAAALHFGKYNTK